MAIAIRGSATNQVEFGGAPFTVNKPTGVVEGDVMLGVIHCQYYNYSDITIPSGWTLLTGRDAGHSYGGHSKVCYKVAGPSEGSSYAFSASSNGAHTTATIIAFSGVPLSGGVPTFVHAQAVTATDTAPPVTPTGSADMLIAMALADHDSGSQPTWTYPAGMTGRMTGGTGYLSHAIATELLSSS